MSFIPNTDFFIEVQKGNVPGHRLVNKFGRNPDVDTGAVEDVWTVGGQRIWLSSPVQLEAISTSANDTLAGSGAQIVTVQGNDFNFDVFEVDINMNGTTASSPTIVTGGIMRVNRAFVKQPGTYHGNNDGTIDIQISGGGAIQAQIAIPGATPSSNKGQTEQTHFTVETGALGIILKVRVSTDASKTINAELYQMPGADVVTPPFGGAKRKLFGVTGMTGPMPPDKEEANFEIVGPADIWWEATSLANNTEVEAGFGILIVSAGFWVP